MRINKYIAANSAHSRRKVDELILDGKVFVNGSKLKSPGLDINPSKDKIKVDGKVIKTDNGEKIYIALNKPTGYVTTRSDELGRKTIMELVPKIDNLKPIGRLDINSEGLILLSNDGEFINKISHPRFECRKEYFILVGGEVSPHEKERLERGVIIDGKRTAPSQIIINKIGSKETSLTIIIGEGRNRQIRKMFGKMNHPVKYLQRIRIGIIPLDDLKKGTYRKLTNKEINVN